MDDKQRVPVRTEVDMNDYYTTRECSEILGISRQAVRKRIDKGDLAAVYLDLGIGKSQYLILKSAVEQAVITKEVVNLEKPLSLPALREELQLVVRRHDEDILRELQEINRRLDAFERANQQSVVAKIRQLFVSWFS